MTALVALYATVWAMAGFHGPQPPIVYAPTISSYAYAAENAGTVYVTAQVVADATGSPQSRATVAAALLHELAHVYQQPGLPRWEAEGGAEAFARDHDWQIRRRFGAFPQHWAYTSLVHRVVHRFGVRWVRRGQFAKEIT